ncbi:MAG: zinc-binding dehydrogenase, partial [Paracoccaceae bacterium]
MLVKNTEAIGLYWGGYLRFNPQALMDSLAELLRWYGNGRLHPHISHRFPLNSIDEAYATLAGRGATGKIVVTVDAGLLP